MNLHEGIRDALSGWPIGSGYYSTAVGTDEASEMADAIMALLKGWQPAVRAIPHNIIDVAARAGDAHDCDFDASGAASALLEAAWAEMLRSAATVCKGLHAETLLEIAARDFEEPDPEKRRCYLPIGAFRTERVSEYVVLFAARAACLDVDPDLWGHLDAEGRQPWLERARSALTAVWPLMLEEAAAMLSEQADAPSEQARRRLLDAAQELRGH